GAVAAADVEHPDDLQRLHGLAQRAARQPERLGQLLLRRQPVAGPQLPGADHLLDLADRVVGDRHQRTSNPPATGIPDGPGSSTATPAGSTCAATGAPSARAAEPSSSRSARAGSTTRPWASTTAHARSEVRVQRTHGSSEAVATAPSSGREPCTTPLCAAIQAASSSRGRRCPSGIAPLAVGPTLSSRFPPRETTSTRWRTRRGPSIRCRESSTWL